MTSPTSAVDALRAMLVAENVAGGPRVDVFIVEALPIRDADGRAHPFIVLHPSPGSVDRTEEPLTAAPGQRIWRCQATCAGGSPARALRALERLQRTVAGRQLTPDSGFIREEGDLGPMQEDVTVSPSRFMAFVDLVVEL